MDDLVYEEQHVHQVYNQIASHFSSTRFKPWPVVDRFLRSLPAGAVGLDVGCGNGKYLTVREDVFIVASDRSSELLKFAAQHQPHAAIEADTLSLPHPDARFDFAICIAVIHHLSTPDRRRDGIRAILRALRRPSPSKPSSLSASASASASASLASYLMTPAQKSPHDQPITKPGPGQGLIFVWALEQKSSRRGWDKGMDQDVLVPWVLKTEHDRSRRAGAGVEIEPGVVANATTAVSKAESQEQKQQRHRDQDRKQDQEEDTERTGKTNSERVRGQASDLAAERTFQRYYHLYREGELEEDIVAAGGKIVETGYDRDNWWAIFEPLI